MSNQVQDDRPALLQRIGELDYALTVRTKELNTAITVNQQFYAEVESLRAQLAELGNADEGNVDDASSIAPESKSGSNRVAAKARKHTTN